MKTTQFKLGDQVMKLAALFMFGACAAGALAQVGPPAKAGGPAGKPGASIESRVRDQIAAQGQATVWVVLREQADLKPAHRMWDWKARGAFVHGKLMEVATRTQQDLQNLLRRRGADFKPVWIVNAIHVTADQATLDEIAARPEVKEILAVRTYSIPTPIRGTPQPGVNGVEWGVDRVKAPQVWQDFGVHGEGIVVCNIDTGVQYDHPALVNQYRGNMGGSVFDHNYNWYDPSLVCGSPSLAPCDNAGHGTHTMGTMVGDDGAGNQIGVAPGARWIAAKGCESSSCSGFALTACAEWILAPTDLNGQNPRPDLRPNIVNNSWGGGQGDPWYQALVQQWIAAGIWPSFSIGNSGSSCWTANSPGDYPESYAAGAFDLNNYIAWFSSRGPSYFMVDGVNIIKPNIAAPGVDVRSSVPGNGYEWYSGTSMASPHVAGTVALLWSAAPALIGDIANTRALLDQTAIDTDDTSCGGTPQNNNIWGEGKLDILTAVTQAPRGDVGTLQGTVTDSVTGLPIAGVQIQAVGPLSRTTLTDGNGFYKFPVLTVGAYDLTATLFGYMGQTASGVLVQKDATTVQDIALQALPAYSVSGFVFDSQGQAVLGATVTVLNTPIAPATTGADGSYSFASVPAGEYDVQAVGCGHCNDPVTQHLTLAGHVTDFNFTLPLRPDAFGYYCTVTTPAYLEANTDIGLSGDDSYSQVNLPFPFTFYGRTYNSAWVSCNGFLTFAEDGAWAFGNGPIPDPSSPNAAIYAFWDDMLVDSFDASVRTELLGTAPNRQFVVEWRNLRRLGWSEVMDVEIVLFENAGILVQYRNVPDNEYYRGLDATIGLENETGTIALQFSYAEATIVSPQFAVFYQLTPGAYLQGHVTDATDTLPIAGATVAVSDGSVLVRSLTTDAEGFYYTRVPLGQYSIQASAPRYASVTAAVTLDTEDATVVQDFALQTPGAAVDPTSLAFTVPSGQSQSQTLTLRNPGSLDLVWEVTEENAFSTDLDSGLPAGTAVYGSAYVAGDGGILNSGVLRLTDAVGSQEGTFVIEDFNDGQPVTQFTARFKVRLADSTCCDGPRPADGFSFNFANNLPNGVGGPNFPCCGAEDGQGSGLTISFDTWDNGAGNDTDAPAIEVIYAGVSKGIVSMAGVREGREPLTPIPTDPATGQPMHMWTDGPGYDDVEIRLEPDGTVDVIYKGVMVLENVATGYVPTAGRFGFGARTGGANETHWVDNLTITLGQTDVPWLTENPNSGTLPSGASQAIQVTVDASTMDTGTYGVPLAILNNSGRAPKLAVPVTVTVWGPHLQGHVTDANNGLPMPGASVRVYREGTLLRSLTTDDAGFYQTELPLGHYTMEATADAYSTETATLTADTLDETYTRDFALRTAYLQGHVTDYNNGQPLPGATVAVSQGGVFLRSVSTMGDGFYSMQLPPGEYLIQASKPSYSTESATRTLQSQSQPYIQDFALRSPTAEVDPTALVFSVPAGQSRSQTLTLRNGGSTDLLWEFSETGGKKILRTKAATRAQNPTNDPNAYTTRGLAVEPAGLPKPATAGDVLKSWMPTGMSWAWGVGYNGNVWLSDLGAWRDVEFTVDGVPTGNAWATWWTYYWPADMAYDAARGLMYQVNVGGDNAIYALAIADGTPMAVITDPSYWNWGYTSQRGVAYRPDDDTLYIGGWNQGIIFHIKGLSWDNPGEVINAYYPYNGDGYEWAIAGLAWDSRRNILWETSNSYYDTIYALNPDTGEVITMLPHPYPVYNGAGLETDQNGNLWILSQGNQTAYLIDTSTDVPWLTENPTSGTLPAGANQLIDVTVDASALEPGVYVAALHLLNNSPRTPKLTVPVTVSVSMVYLQGHVTDYNTGRAIAGANVLVLNPDGEAVRNLFTDADGFYSTQVPLGQYVVQASTPSYSTETQDLVANTQDDVYTLNFALKAPQAEVSPSSLDFRVAAGQSKSQTLTLRNSGSLDLVWELTESGGKKILRAPTIITVQSQDYDSNARTSQGLTVEPDDLPAPDTPGDILASWAPAGVTYPWGVGYQGNVWISDFYFYYNRSVYANVEFTVDGTPTGVKWRPDWAGVWAADMAFDTKRNWMCQVNVGGDNGIYCWDPATGTVMASIKGSFTWTSSSQRGLAYRPDDDTFYIGGWNQGRIYHIKGLSWDKPGEILNYFYPHNGNGYEWAISGLGWDSRRNILWEASNSYYDTLYALNPDTGEVLSMLPLPTSYYSGAGLETDQNGNLWTVSQSSRMVYLINTSTDVPWLTENPTSGTLPPGASQEISVTVDSGTLQPGVYAAALTIANNSALAPKLTVPVSMAVSMAFLQGHVTDANNGAPLKAARVQVYKDSTLLRSLLTDAAGFYQTQVPLGTYVVQATTTNYSTESATVMVDAQDATYTQDFVLRTAYLQGVVTDFNTGLPIAQANVRLYQGGVLKRSLSTTAQGFYRTQLPPGEYLIQATKYGYSTESATRTLESRQEPAVQDFVLRTAYLQGNVTDANNGQPIAWAEVVVYQNGNPVRWLYTDWNGYYSTQLSPGQYVVEASAWAYSTESATVTLESRQQPYIQDFALRTAYLQGHITDANNGLPIVGASVAVYQLDGYFANWLVTDASGFYFTQLPPGQYMIEASANLYSTESATLTIESRADPYTQDLALRTAYLRGRVTDANDKLPVAGATVVISSDWWWQTLTTDGTGAYFVQMPPGQYVVEASANRYSTESATITLNSQPEAELPPGLIRRSPLADTFADWSTTAEQGSKGWYYGYYDLSLDADGIYQPDNFTLFPHDGGGWSPTDFWDGAEWDWFNGNPPWTEIRRDWEHPNSPNGWEVDPGNPATHEHWAIRRWTCTVPGTHNLTCHLKFRKGDCYYGDGVIVYIFREGTMVYSNAIAYYDESGRDDLIYLPNVMGGERIDIALAPGSTDYCDNAYLSATIFSRPPASVQDLALRTPLAMAAPASLQFVVTEGQRKTHRLTLQNLGGLDLTWRIRDSAAIQSAAPQGAGMRFYKTDAGLSMTNNAGSTALASPTAFYWQPAQPSTALNILIYADDYYHWAPYTYLDQALQRLALPYVAYYNAYWSGFEAALTSGTWDIVLVGNDTWIPPWSTLDALNSYVLGGGKLVYHGWTVGYYSYGHPLWTTLGFNFVYNDYDPPDPVYWWDPTHMIFTDPESVPEFTALNYWRYGIYGQYVEPLPDFDALAGYTTPGPDPNQAALILGNSGRTVFKGFLDGQNDADLDGDGIWDGVELWENLIAGIQIGFWPDLAWLSESPTSGTQAPQEPQVIQVTVDASALAPGTYSASLTIPNNSGRIQKLVVPVNVTVLPYKVALNAGGQTYTDVAGDEWSADQAWAGSDWGYVGTSTTISSGTTVAGTPDPKLYATARQGQFEYRFAVPRASVYQVELRFAELQSLKPTQRVFDIQLEGIPVLPAHDIVGEVGRLKADNHTFQVNVADGQLNINFIARPNKKLPIVNAIRVTRQLQ